MAEVRDGDPTRRSRIEQEETLATARTRPTTEVLRAVYQVVSPRMVMSVPPSMKTIWRSGSPFHFIPRLYWPGMDFDLQREVVRVFAADVIPQLRP